MRVLPGILMATLLGLPLAAQATPERVVSMNVCTDQLAMLIAPEQVVSVSYLASDPRSSAMVEQAGRYHANRGLAEEIFLLQPDLVLAGTYATSATVALLRSLGIPVVTFAPASSLEDVRVRLREMGAALGRTERAQALIAEFDLALAATRNTRRERPRAATYHANSYTSGAETLAGSIMEAAGLANIATEHGLPGGGTIALEEMILANPDLIITGRPYDTPSQAEQVLAHPALAALRQRATTAPFTDRDWVCGTPFVISAIRRLAAARDAVLGR